MLKRILSYGFIEGVAKGLNKLILLLLPFILGTIDFGKVGLILSIETLLPFITLLGFERVILRFYSQHDEFKNFDRTINIAINIAHFLVLCFLIIAYIYGVRDIFGLYVFPDLFLLLILVYLQGTNLLVLNKLRVQGLHSKYFGARLFLQIGKFLLVFLLVYFTESYIGYLIGGILIAFITNIVFRVTGSTTITQKFDSVTFKNLFAFSWPFIFHGLATNLLGNGDKFIIEKYLTLFEVGQYTFVYSIGSMMVFGFVGISVYLEPLIYKATVEKKEKYLNDYLLYGTAISTILYFCINIFSHYLMDYFYSNSYRDVAYLIPLIAISFVVYPYYLTANYRMIYDKRTKRIAFLSILTCLLNIGLNFLLIPKFGLYASVLVTFISYVTQALLFTYISVGGRIERQVLEVVVISLSFYLCMFFNAHYLVVTVLLGSLVIYFFFTGEKLYKRNAK
ncbi:oligosaccharide flippase family protein [Sphingobacterium sp. SGR-19]|uniref:oligosaccharide flippase family protein n=1 Tax=Sphingobacterium sp. SGR-19 TaxID=2710886 RepID=UPI0013EAF9E2|nr:oligosaccharide flippase family protein [Sphingobacterium sp. SGR-19]NGM67223.1 oligosaccharide flippase family protein [Sphingobacterium sp. SGR-19]